jgi:hypothetical protein
MLILFDGVIKGIEHVIDDYDKLEENQSLKKNLEEEIRILKSIGDDFKFIKERFYPDEIINHNTYLPSFRSFEIKLNKILGEMKSLFNRQKFINFLSFDYSPFPMILSWFGISNGLNDKHKSFTENLYTISNDFVNLKQKLYGKALLFEDNAFGCKLWLQCNAQDIDSLSKDLFIERLITLFRKKYTAEYKNNVEVCKKCIKMFAHNLDGCIGDKPDNIITIDELNDKTEDVPQEYPLIQLLAIDVEINDIVPAHEDTEPSKTDNVFLNTISEYLIDPINDHVVEPIKSAIFLEQQDSEDIQAHLIYNHNSTESVSYKEEKTAIVEAFKDWTGYGAGLGWPTKEVCTITGPSTESSRMCIKYTARDQEFGGTGHSSVRYKLNDEEPVLMYFIDRNVNTENTYTYQVIQYIPANSTLTLYICSPAWSGWATHLDTAQVIFIK